ncbi:hypothetical protein [Geobacter sp. OR-1]|uniref:hypothetical protein n=1 Tax=Geobacter sp. OR-1 TaxID=1266765 RepID=UPI0013649699|nr:hypothetical protein [Geobacter sp. OR-1]
MADRERRPAMTAWGAVKSCNLREEDDITARQGNVNISYTSIFSNKASFFIKRPFLGKNVL